jgi:membrane fusion protein, heavy metal efflux system
MNIVETGSIQHIPPTTGAEAHEHPRPHLPRRKPSALGKFLRFLIFFGLVGGAGWYVYKFGVKKTEADLQHAVSAVRKYLPEGSEEASVTSPTEVKPRPPWDGFVKIDEEQAKAIGLQVVTVQPQVKPIKLELTGRTDYDPNSLTKIRPRFDTLVEDVRTDLGKKVVKGDPLVDLFSTELAQAKNDFQIAFVQWQHDLRLLKMREELRKQDAIAVQVLVDSQNDEHKSRLTYTTAREKLKILGVPEDQVDPLLKNLSVDLPMPQQIHNISEKAKMTRLSPVDGIVIQREVVKGNFYDTNDVLMVIAPLDHLFVWVNVYEKDQAKVYVGQRMEIYFPYMNETIGGTVEYVSTEVSKDTRAVKIRATIANVGGKLKADMLVRAGLEIPPIKGQTVIPRLAMVVMNGNEYAFIRKPKTNPKDPERFERHQIVAAQERSEIVVVASGLKPGEEVASNGALILSQLFEDQQMVETGMPMQ